jgi:hypothetical protein
MYVVIRTGDGLCTLEGISRPMFSKEGTLGIASPYPSFQGANCPSSSPLSLGCGAQQWQRPLPEICRVSCLRCGDTRDAACTARVSLAPNRDSETKCVLWPFHVCVCLI